MLLGKKKTINDFALEALLEGPRTVLAIQEYLRPKGESVTVQGIYKALRELISEDIIVKQKQVYSINNVWREKAASLFANRNRFKLSPGEQVVYRFQKLEHLDAFWKHTLADIELETKGFPVFHFTPHQFWPLVPGRRESEQEYYAELDNHQIHVYTVIGGNTLADATARETLRTFYHQIFLDPSINLNRRDHISVIENYIITTRISVKLAREIDQAYETTANETDLSKKFSVMFRNPGSITMIVENNRPKAKKLRKRLSADFHLPLELREKFDLF